MLGKISIVDFTKMQKYFFASPLGAEVFLKIKNDILGKEYSLSIAFVEKEKSKEINNKYRKKNKPTNVLSFPLRENKGEILLCPEIIKKEVQNKKFNKTFPELICFLVIHGMLHLKGFKHSSTMEKAEKLYCKKYVKKYFSGDRFGFQNDKGRSGRIRKGRKKS